MRAHQNVPRVYRSLVSAMVGSEVGTDWAGSNAIAIDRFGQVTGVQAIGGTTSTRAGGTDRFIVDSDRQTPST
jgi:hypothetical protein